MQSPQLTAERIKPMSAQSRKSRVGSLFAYAGKAINSTKDSTWTTADQKQKRARPEKSQRSDVHRKVTADASLTDPSVMSRG